MPEKYFNDYNTFKDILKNVTDSFPELCKDFNYQSLIYFIFKNSLYEISPICGYGGGVASQEIIK